jgi:oxygen-independent coproporphyrinogen-3 oxidase
MIQMPLGLYISVPFCRAKCSYCNFASGVFSSSWSDRYLARLAAEIHAAQETANALGGRFDDIADSIYVGGGTPTILDVAQLEGLFVTIRQNFKVAGAVEITVECAPGTLPPEILPSLKRCQVNRVSLGVQSFVDQEAAAVGRLHKRATVVDDVARLRSAGIFNINVDLIAGLPHQSRKSWEESLEELIRLEVPHASIYMLEVDEDSRLGRELIAGGARYHAHFVPDDDLTADLYERACQALEGAGVEQYEISNFARPGFESRHNMKYWTRDPYFGFGLDAHSMLAGTEGNDALRFSNPDTLEDYLAERAPVRTLVGPDAALEESLFLGLRLTAGVDLSRLARKFGAPSVEAYSEIIEELVEAKLLERLSEHIRLTLRGRLLSNEVFERFISPVAR